MKLLNKDNFPKLTDRQKQRLALGCVALAMVGFLWSRPLLSIATIGLGVVGIWGHRPAVWLQNRYWVWGVVWLVLLANTGFWTIDLTAYSILMQVKLPILILPISFALLPAFTQAQKKTFTIIIASALSIGMCYSLYFFLRHSQEIIQGYGTSKVLPTLTDSDHIRFSLCVALFINWCLYGASALTGRAFNILLAVFVACAVVFLHLLAARTGLLALYISLAGWVAYFLWKWKWQHSLAVMLLTTGLLWASFQYIPTLHTRLGYTRYTIEQYLQGNRSATYSDLGRLISYKAGWYVFKQNPILGVGLGDVVEACKSFYAHALPQEQPRDLLPHNQLLIEAAAGGILVLLPFLVWYGYPLRKLRKSKQGLHLLLVWCILTVAAMIEPLLEIQMGVFVFQFFLLWAMKEQSDSPQSEKTTTS